MPDDRTTGRVLAEHAVPVTTATARAATAERLPAQSLDLLNRSVEDVVHASQEFTTRASQNAQTLLDLTELSASGWQQVASELMVYGQQTAEHQATAFTMALMRCQPADLVRLQSQFFMELVRSQLQTSARLAEIARNVAKRAAHRRSSQP